MKHSKRKYKPSRRLLANYERARKAQPPMKTPAGGIGNERQYSDIREKMQ